MLEGLFQLLFKYRPAVFAKGELAFGVAGPIALALLVLAIAAAATILSYRRVGVHSTSRDRVLLGVLRAAVLVVILACLSRPMLLLSAPVPQRNFVGVLVDDSRSMQITERGGRSRADVVRDALGDGASSILPALRDRFQVRIFRFGSSADRVDGISDLKFADPETRVSAAVAQVRQELDAVPLSGLVVLTDGADNAGDAMSAELSSLRARAVPVFAVGVGAERFDRDVEIERVELPRQVMEGSSFVANVVIRQRGFGRQKVPLVVEDEGRVIAREEVELPRDGASAPIRLPVTVRTAGPRHLRFYVPVARGELLSQNNERRALLDVRHRREKILYIEGEPRYEVRFVREAVEADSNLQVVVLQRTAENKYLRLNVDTASELAGGFPVTRAELFRYRAIVLGSIEASAFTSDQLRMLADFVSVRGGGMLFLGGRRAFGEGGYAGTPLSDIYPVFVDGDAVPDTLTPFNELAVRVTPAGSVHPATQHISRRGAAPPSTPDSTPIQRVPVTSVNRVTRLKPGAIALLEGSAGRYKQPVLAYQRYGRGLSVALPIQDSWLWAMHASVPVGDPTHRTLWRQLLRWIASDTPEQLRMGASAGRVRPGGSVTIRAEVADSGYVRRNDARLVAQIRAPSGAVREQSLEWVVDRDGEYQTSISSDEPGLHMVRVVTVGRAGETTLGDSAFVEVADLQAEFFGAEMRKSLLQRLAHETGGRFYTPETMRTLPEDIALTKRGVTVVNQMDLWDMPVVLVILMVLLSVEWAYRRRRGLA